MTYIYLSEAEGYVERARWKQRGRDRERGLRAAVDASGPTGEVESRWVRTSRWGLIGEPELVCALRTKPKAVGDCEIRLFIGPPLMTGRDRDRSLTDALYIYVYTTSRTTRTMNTHLILLCFL